MIDTMQKVQEKMKLCDVLGDITIAQSMMKAPKPSKLIKHPADEHYESLDADLGTVPVKSKEYEIILNYLQVRKSRSKVSSLLTAISACTLLCLLESIFSWASPNNHCFFLMNPWNLQALR